MSTGWENHEPAPLEFFHSRLLDLFHELRKEYNDDIVISISAATLNIMIAQTKTETYSKYPEKILTQKAVHKDLLKI